jgi:hypothetical protein
MTPRQWIAVICIAAAVGSSSLRLVCESACASQHASRTTLHCHEVAEAGAMVNAAVDCGQHDAFPALTEGRRLGMSPELLAFPAPTNSFAQPTGVVIGDAEAFADTGPPPLVRALPLRI